MIRKLFAGIDISSNDAVLCCLDQDGQQLGPSRKYSNDFEGANQLLEAISAFEAEEVHVGFEATSVYGAHLRDFLLSTSGWFVYEINPSLVAGFKQSFLNGLRLIILTLGLLPNEFASVGLSPILIKESSLNHCFN